MGPVAVSRRHGMHDRRLLPVVEALEGGKRGMEGKEAVERQRGALARSGEGEIAVQVGIVRIADRRDRRQPVERAAQDDDDEARVARRGGARRPADEARAAKDAGAERACAPDESAARQGDTEAAAAHRHLRWNSGAMNTSASACSRASARSTARRVSSYAVSPSAVSSVASGSPPP